MNKLLEDCIFCKIVKGIIPGQVLLEDDYFMAILDVAPATAGHTLVIPKTHAEGLFDLPAEHGERLTAFIRRVAEAVKAETGADGVNILQNNGSAAGQVVFHYHAHIIPRYVNDGLPLPWMPRRDKPTNEELSTLAAGIRGRL